RTMVLRPLLPRTGHHDPPIIVPPRRLFPDRRPSTATLRSSSRRSRARLCPDARFRRRAASPVAGSLGTAGHGVAVGGTGRDARGRGSPAVAPVRPRMTQTMYAEGAPKVRDTYD